MATYTLTLKFDPIIVQKASSDNLNIARKVNGEFTTTFAGASFKPIGQQHNLFEVNTFSWTDEYSVLLSTKLAHGLLVSAATSAQQIAFGQEVDFKDNVLTNAAPAPPGAFSNSNPQDSFVLGGVPDFLSAAVASKVGSLWVPIYVDNRAANGVQSKQLTPQNEFALFFDSLVVTGSMIDYAKTTKPYTFKFDLGSHNKTLRYGYKSPNSPSPSTEQPEWYSET